MCGIAGCIKFGHAARVEASTLQRMCAAMVHRGPDDEGIIALGNVGLGARRLSIIDVVHGHQPISNEDGTIWVVFNGEIYNHAELRSRLQAVGHLYSTRSDTETIVHAYEEYGRKCVKHLRGMFAFAIWDSRTRQLFMARDRLGIKPLYYRLKTDSLLFGSEIKVILAHPEVTATFNRSMLPEYLAFGYLSGQETFYEGIRKLPPGHTMLIDDAGEPEIDRYWDLEIREVEQAHPETYFVEGYREQLEKAVQSHLMSDVPLGVFLSGGLDSSTIAALATKVRGEPIETFSVGYAEDSFSELPQARTVANHLNSIHHGVVLSEQEFFDALPRLIWQEDEPVSWPSSVALYFVSELASSRVKVVLTGEGSDETLGGYSRYAFTLKNAAADRIYRGLLPRSVRAAVRRGVVQSSLLSASARRKLSHTFLARNGESWQSFYFDNFFSAFGSQHQSELLTQDFLNERRDGYPYSNVLRIWNCAPGNMLQKMLYTDIKTYLVELLMKQDSMSMAASIESRVPFLDHELVEYAITIPAEFQIKRTSGKHILKRAVQDLLPNDIVYRKKLGFPTPWSTWLSGSGFHRVDQILLDARTVERGFFKPEAIAKLLGEHRLRHHDHYDRIWKLLNFEIWYRVCIEGDAVTGGSLARELASRVV